MAARTRSEDPSRTKTHRQTYAQRLRGAYGRINAYIRNSVEKRDIFGLRDSELYADASPPGNYQFLSDPQKVEAFVAWLEQAQEDEVLEIIDQDDNRFIRRSYGTGLENAHNDLKRAGYDVTEDDVQALFNQPIHEDTLQDLYTRNFVGTDDPNINGLVGITEDVADDIREELTQAFVEGVNPRETARRITGRVDSIGKTRATILARTETLHAHNEAKLTRFQQTLGAHIDVQVDAEIRTAQDARVCEICEPRHGEVMAIDMARADSPPWHPQCRCTFVPRIDE